MFPWPVNHLCAVLYMCVYICTHIQSRFLTPRRVGTTVPQCSAVDGEAHSSLQWFQWTNLVIFVLCFLFVHLVIQESRKLLYCVSLGRFCAIWNMHSGVRLPECSSWLHYVSTPWIILSSVYLSSLSILIWKNRWWYLVSSS